MRKLLPVFLLLLSNIIFSQTTIVPFSASWKYLDNGSNQGTAWRATAFNDAAWPSGTAELGYGDGDETTVVSFGPNASQKYITTYFRKTITVSNPALFTGLTLSIRRDDGAVVYINGTERFRTNMPTGSISYTTRASTDAADDGETAQTVSLAASVLLPGTNVIAVEIHQRTRTSSDISFDLELTAAGDVSPPVVNILSPLDDALNVPVTGLSIITFNEPIQKGAGLITIKENGVAVQTIDVASAAVTVAGPVVSINAANYTNGTGVNIEITPGAFLDLAGNSFAGITSSTAWNFNIISLDLVPPVALTYSPTDEATGVSTNSDLILSFNEQVQKGTGNIIIRQNGSIAQTIDVSSATVTIAGSVVTINSSDFSYSTGVSIEIAPGAFLDLAGNSYAGIQDVSTWNFTTVAAPQGPQTFIAFGDAWKYLDNGSNQGTAWRSSSFNDAAWATGNAQLGYGDGDETTLVSFGPNANAKYITTYFRKTINISDPSSFSAFNGSVRRDDGVVIYVNGTEVYRSNMPTGTVSYTTLASSAASDDGNTAQNFSISTAAFTSGSNVIAVEMHQNAATSSDLSFDLQLIGAVPGAALITRGPYLNMGNQTAVTLRWRTDIATNSRVEVGTTVGTYPIVVNDGAAVTEHEVRVTGLNADTKYYYRIGSSTQVLQGGSDNFFTTQPPANITRKMRFAAFGDCGRNDNGFQTGSLSSYLNFAGANTAEVLLLLGDNAYNNGTDAEYQSNFFNAYSTNILKNHQLYPAPGNHDYYSTTQASRTGAYYQNFTMPTAAECGGVASGTEAYYSWDWGNVHFLSLDSYGTENSGTTRLYDTLGAQAVWVKQDLAANTKPWVVVYWHHPPYTMGSHNSDTEGELISMRQNFIRILERMGADLIVCGHSHDYERSYLLNGHYGTEATFNVNTHTLSNSSGKYDGSANSCSYNTTNGQNHGTVYVVSGSAGADGAVQTAFPHNAMPWSVDDGGMFYFEVEDNRLDAKFIRRTGAISDQFTIMKNVGKVTNTSTPPATPTMLTASWSGTYNWSTGATSRSITVAPTANTTYTVVDGQGCITDTFHITINTGRFSDNTRSIVQEKTGVGIQPTLVARGTPVMIRTGTGQPANATVYNAGGQIISQQKFNSFLRIETVNLRPGIYYVQLNSPGGEMLKFMVIE